MQASHALVLALFATAVAGQAAMAQAVRVTNSFMAPGQGTPLSGWGPGVVPVLDVAVIGTVIEVEPAPVLVAPSKGAPKEQAVAYKVANVKIEDRLLGASGVTRLRVGFVADIPAATLTPNMEGCFSLTRHPNADFFVAFNPPVQKKDPEYAKEFGRLKKVGLAVGDPVAALKAKDLDDRFEAAQILLHRYRTVRGSTDRELIPDEENRLFVALLKELPWNPPGGNASRADGRTVPHRSILWYAISANETGFKRPERPKQKPGDPPVDYEKLMDEATARFLKENGDTIRFKRWVWK